MGLSEITKSSKKMEKKKGVLPIRKLHFGHSQVAQAVVCRIMIIEPYLKITLLIIIGEKWKYLEIITFTFSWYDYLL